MAKLNDTTTYPNTTPALDDHVIGTDVSDTGNSADGEIVTFLLGDIVKLGGFKGLQVFTSSGTWTKPTGVNSVLVFVTGGGGGCSDSVSGGAAGTAVKRLDVAGVGSATITVGLGGAYSSLGGGNGSASSWADGTNTITGGGGSATGTPGAGSGGDLNLAGESELLTASRASFWGSTYGRGARSGETGGAPSGVVVVFEFG